MNVQGKRLILTGLILTIVAELIVSIAGAAWLDFSGKEILAIYAGVVTVSLILVAACVYIENAKSRNYSRNQEASL